MTENNSVAFLSFCRGITKSTRQLALGSGRGDGELAQEGQTHEVTLEPRTLGDESKRAETASDRGLWEHLTPYQSHQHEDMVLSSQCCPPSSSVLQISFWGPTHFFFFFFFKESIVLLLLEDHLLLVTWFKFHLVFLLPCTVI